MSVIYFLLFPGRCLAYSHLLNFLAIFLLFSRFLSLVNRIDVAVGAHGYQHVTQLRKWFRKILIPILIDIVRIVAFKNLFVVATGRCK